MSWNAGRPKYPDEHQDPPCTAQPKSAVVSTCLQTDEHALAMLHLLLQRNAIRAALLGLKGPCRPCLGYKITGHACNCTTWNDHLAPQQCYVGTSAFHTGGH